MQPPNEPPYQPPYQPPEQSPIPSPYAPPTSGAVPPQGPPQVNFDVVSHAWEMLKPTMGVWVGGYLIYFVIAFGVSSIVNQLTGSGFSPGQSNAMPNFPLLILGQVISITVSVFLMGGLYRMAINQVRTGSVNLGDMFSVVDVLPSLFVTSLLSILAIFVGALFCLIPGLLIGGLLMFALPLVVDKQMGALDAMKTSIDALKPQMWMATAFSIVVIGLLSSVGVVFCCVGLLITGPLAILSTAILYRDFFPNQTLA